MTPELVSALCAALVGGIAVLVRKSKCFIRKLGPGIQYGIGFTDKPLLPGTPEKVKQKKNIISK